MATTPDRSTAISQLRVVSREIIDCLYNAIKLRRRAEILTGGQGFAADDFAGTNAALQPADFAALETSLDALSVVFTDAQGAPTPTLIALERFATPPTT